MNTPDTAPKDGSQFIGDFGEFSCVTMWSDFFHGFICVVKQASEECGVLTGVHYETRYENSNELLGWCPMSGVDDERQ